MRQGFFLFLVVSFFTFSSVLADPADTATTAEYNKDGLTLMYFFVDYAKFFDDWSNPEPPLITNTRLVNRGDSIFPIVLFETDAVDDSGNANLTYDITILRPDGSEYGSYSDLVICDNGPASGAFYLLQQPIVIRIEGDDPFGIYKVDLVIKENNKNVTVPLSLSFSVEEDDFVSSALDTLSHISELYDLDLFISEYYMAPRPDLVSEALIFAADLGVLSNSKTISANYGFFAVVFSQNEEALKEWKEIGKSHKALSEFIKKAANASKDPNKVFKNEDIEPGLNDLYWGAYFASGNIYYIKQIVLHLEYTDERKDLMKYLTGATAEWSLCSNAADRPRVKGGLILLAKEAEPEIATKINILLNSDPADVQQKMEDVCNEQVEKGVW